ncbi:ATPase, AAA family protein [Croceitalea dokdonensis DOKDO 023]|uniref:ATPase, AAA family protein n=1 Tax=Croceitalea dokdonensis DOKDO 023 TaxID=1300341 RepID=A0A0P7B0R9_9FLAO|nr:ATP-binding protein [Croceitalea dokdonensis]KPM31510.1 ATPase, AAA family protein [Croceitalea dokdonensis DOKDO 023]
MENNILKDIIQFSKAVKGCKLSEEILTKDSDYIHRIETYFGTTRFQSMLLVAVFDVNSEGTKPSQADLAKYFKCNTIELFVYKKEMDTLVKRGIFDDRTGLFSFGRSERYAFHISERIRDAIIENKPYEQQVQKPLNAVELCKEIYGLVHKCASEGLKTPRLYRQVNHLLEGYKETPFVHYINGLHLSQPDRLCYIYLIADNLKGNLSSHLTSFSDCIFDNKRDQIFYEKAIYEESAPLIKNGFIKLNQETYFSNANVSLTEQSSKKLATFDIPIRLMLKEKDIPLINTTSIVRQKLFYNAATKTELDSITQSLRPLKYKQITKALQQEGFRTGLCTLFYGAPGTGKTEAVYQIAKTTARAIWKVDLSELKSMWFGESQKLVKALFKDYKELCAREKRTPIMLLNEADAILGKRNAQTTSKIDKTENAIQNIFLDCLEDFEGILFATTNLEESLDTAFERRFLFKLCFKRPSTATRAKIWQTKLRGLRQPTAMQLAEQYDLSGGEIENIVRKYKMARVLDPSIAFRNKLTELCESEKLQTKKERSAIGF